MKKKITKKKKKKNGDKKRNGKGKTEKKAKKRDIITDKTNVRNNALNGCGFLAVTTIFDCWYCLISPTSIDNPTPSPPSPPLKEKLF